MFAQWLARFFSGVRVGLMSSIVLKLGADVSNLAPELTARLNAAQRALLSRGMGLRVTAGRNGKHRIGSFHYNGTAVDITPANRADGFNPARRRVYIGALQAQGLRVVDEYAQASANSTGGHLHVEWRG